MLIFECAGEFVCRIVIYHLNYLIMKRTLFLSVAVLLTAVGCVREDAEMSGPRADAEVKTVPHIYGWATLDDSAPQTRGIALRKKKWGGSDARDFITVKFLNGVEPYKKFVKEVPTNGNCTGM